MTLVSVSVAQTQAVVNEDAIQDCMTRNGVSRAWAVIMLEPPPQFSEADYSADYERMRRESYAGFTGEWALEVKNFTLDDVPEIPYDNRG